MKKRILIALLSLILALLLLCSCEKGEDGLYILPGEDPETNNALQTPSGGFLTLMIWNYVVDEETWQSLDSILLVPLLLIVSPVVICYEIFQVIAAGFVILIMLAISGYFG